MKLKNIFCRIISIIILTIFFMSYILPITSVIASSNYSNYVALGDSIAYGYGLENKETECYASKVKKYYNIDDNNYSNMAVSGMTCEEFYNIIKTENYTEAIEKADLITVSIGSNELLGLAIDAVSEITKTNREDPDFQNKAEQAFLNASVAEKAKMLKQIYDFFTSEQTKVKIDDSISKYQQTWGEAVNYIKEINNDVTIVATQFYNPYYEFALLSYDLGGFVDESIQKMNQILTQMSNNETNYKIAKIYDSFNTTDPRITNVNLSLTNFNIDPHPNITGHELIYTKIVDVLSEEQTEQKRDISTLTISDIQDQEYTGQAIKPQIQIKDGNTILQENTDYVVVYQNNQEVGQALIIINGIGKYTGKVTKTFNIKDVQKQKDINSLNIENIEDQTYTGIAITPDIKILEGTKQLVNSKDYTLKYVNNVNTGEAQIYVYGIGDYTGETTVNFKIIPKPISETQIEDIESQIYTGEEIQPELTITNGSFELIKDKDYTLTYENNTQIGEASVIINGIENYTGTTTKNFNIIQQQQSTKKDISQLSIAEIENKIYTGKAITPEVRIIDENKTLIKDVDYILTYRNNIQVGTGNITIEGIGEYTGIIQKTFTIERKDIKFTKISDIKDQNYTGETIEPEIIISSDGIKLVEGTDYTVQYQNNSEIGTATIKITGINNYTGEIIKTFNIIEQKKDSNDDDKKQDDNNETDNKQQGNSSNFPFSKLPYAGKTTLLITILCISIFATIMFYKLYKNNKWN